VAVDLDLRKREEDKEKKVVMAEDLMGKKEDKISFVMKEFKKGKLKSGKSNKKVVNKKQAIAIAISEANKKKKRRTS
jgi:hypothetical protein